MNKKLRDAMAIKQQMNAANQVEQVARIEVPFASDFVLSALQQMALHRRAVLLPGPLTITAELCHVVAMRAIADRIIEVILAQQPGMVGLVDPISKRVRAGVSISPVAPASPIIVPSSNHDHRRAEQADRVEQDQEQADRQDGQDDLAERRGREGQQRDDPVDHAEDEAPDQDRDQQSDHPLSLQP